MSVNLYLQTLDGKNHPTWDDGNYAGTRQLHGMMAEPIFENRLNNIGGGDIWMGAEPVFRPTSIPEFRELLSRFDFNSETWKQLADILESEPEYWMWFSI